MNNDIIKEKVLFVVKDYPVKRVVLFGSRAEETNGEDSDVDIIHGPIREGDLIEVGKEIELYVA